MKRKFYALLALTLTILLVFINTRFNQLDGANYGSQSLPDDVVPQLYFIGAELRAGAGELPPPREFTREQIEQWMADDEEGYRRFLSAQ